MCDLSSLWTSKASPAPTLRGHCISQPMPLLLQTHPIPGRSQTPKALPRLADITEVVTRRQERSSDSTHLLAEL